jgi:tetratricopeptide (TPR) repeat protein
MKPESQDDDGGNDRSGLLRLVGLATVLGVSTWLLLTILLPARLPEGFPKLPDVQALNPGLRALLVSADKDARRHPGSAEVMGRLGMAYHANQYLAQAASAYQIAARLAPHDSQWVYCQAYLQEENGNEEEQFKLLQQTVRLKPDHVPALLKLGDAYFKQDKLDEAAHYYEEAAGAADGDSALQATFGLARVAAGRQQWNKVIEYVSGLSRTYPYVRPPFQLLQKAYEALGQADKAAEVRESILLRKFTVMPPVKDPLNEQLVNLSYSSTRLLKEAGVLSRFGYPDRGIEVARRALDADPGDADIRHFIARTLITFHPDKPEEVDEALTQLGEGLRLNPDDLVPLWDFSAAFFETPQTPAAVERLGALLRAHADRAEAHLYLGRVADQQGKTDEAVAECQAALKNNPNNAEAYNQLGLILVSTGKLERAVGYLQKSVQLDPMYNVYRFNLGVALVQQGNNGQALRELGQVLRLKPNDVPTHLYMGIALLASKRTEEAILHFREALRFKPDEVQAHYGLGCALSLQRKREDAIKEVREALRLRPNYPEAQDLLQRLEH